MPWEVCPYYGNNTGSKSRVNPLDIFAIQSDSEFSEHGNSLCFCKNWLHGMMT